MAKKSLALEVAHRQAVTGRRRAEAASRHRGLRVHVEGAAGAIVALLRELNDGPNDAWMDSALGGASAHTEISTWVTVNGPLPRAREIIEKHNQRGRATGLFDARTDNTGGL